MWSKICRFSNFALLIYSVITLVIVVVNYVIEFHTIIVDIYDWASFLLALIKLLASLGLVVTLSWMWQTGSIRRLKGEIKDRTLMW